MIGHEGNARALVRLLRDRGQAAARLVEVEAGLEPGVIEVPAPDNIHATWVDVVSKGRFPTWMVMARDTPLRRTARESDRDGEYDETEWRYPFLIATHVVGGHENDVALQRYRLMLVVRTILIQAKGLIRTPTERSVIYLDDMQEIVGGMAENGGKYLLEGRNEFHITSTERTPAIQPSLGPVEGFATDETFLPEEP